MTFKEKLDKKSQDNDDSGFIHYGWIHYIQNKSTEEGFDGFNLKAGIYSVIENVPHNIPENLPELAEKKDFEPSQKLIDCITNINKNLLIPLQGYNVVNIIKWAKEYLKMEIKQ